MFRIHSLQNDTSDACSFSSTSIVPAARKVDRYAVRDRVLERDRAPAVGAAHEDQVGIRDEVTPAPVRWSASTWRAMKAPLFSTFFESPTLRSPTSVSRTRWDALLTGLRRRIDMPSDTSS